jgi:hypothetical protein
VRSLFAIDIVDRLPTLSRLRGFASGQPSSQSACFVDFTINKRGHVLVPLVLSLGFRLSSAALAVWGHSVFAPTMLTYFDDSC